MSAPKRKNPFPISIEEPPSQVSKNLSKQRSVPDDAETSDAIMSEAPGASGEYSKRPIKRAISRKKSYGGDSSMDVCHNFNDTSASEYLPQVSSVQRRTAWHRENIFRTYHQRDISVIFNDFRSISFDSIMGNIGLRSPGRRFYTSSQDIKDLINGLSTLSIGARQYNLRTPPSDVARYALPRSQSDVARYALPRSKSDVLRYALPRSQSDVARYALPRSKSDILRYALTRPQSDIVTYSLPRSKNDILRYSLSRPQIDIARFSMNRPEDIALNRSQSIPRLSLMETSQGPSNVVRYPILSAKGVGGF